MSFSQPAESPRVPGVRAAHLTGGIWRAHDMERAGDRTIGSTRHDAAKNFRTGYPSMNAFIAGVASVSSR